MHITSEAVLLQDNTGYSMKEIKAEFKKKERKNAQIFRGV